MNERINSWGVYSWFIEHGEDLIEPRDREKFKKLNPYGKLFECIGEEENYILLRYNKEVYRVNPILYKKVNNPKFQIGNKVRLVNKVDVVGEIVDINWHFKENEPLYFISINSKRKSKRYMDEDFLICNI